MRMRYGECDFKKERMRVRVNEKKRRSEGDVGGEANSLREKKPREDTEGRARGEP